MTRALVFLLVGFYLAGMTPSSSAQSLYDGDGFTVTDTSVVQGDVRALAPSRTTLVSNYQRERTTLTFTFSINGQDNEAPSGKDLRLRLSPAAGRVLTPVYVFGERPEGDPFPQPRMATPRPHSDSVEVVFRVDMRPMLRSFRHHGYYDPPSGERIQEADFQGVYILGDTAPLTWNGGRVADTDRFRLADPDGDGVYHIALRFARRDVRPLDENGNAVWRLSDELSDDMSDVPQYRSDQRLVDALYNLSLEEMLLNLRKEDGAFMAGAKWNGVWTRDISYSILLSLALAAPEQAKTSLRAKVSDDGRIIQDTGTGGSWPVSSDRMTWALAAWEVYLTTGDRAWLQESFDIIRRSAEADAYAVYDSTTGLVHGEASFMDWREQSYPDWMDPKDIYESQVLSTNVVHYRTHRILAQMAEALGEPSERWAERAGSIRAAINQHLWVPEAGRYGSFRYGRHYKTLEPRAEALGAALAILTGVAADDRAASVAQHHPVTRFGVPSFWPYIPDIPPYHNAGIWPFVGSLWTWASADAGNTPGVEHGLGTLYRAAALFLTNKENMVAQTGHFEGTQINSDRQLWSVAGTLASVYRVLFGMRFSPEGLRFTPFVPEGYTGTRTLTNVRYREATLNIEMRGHGTRIVHMTLDGQTLRDPVLPPDLTGNHSVTIILSGGLPRGTMTLVQDRYTPAAPDVQHVGAHLEWTPVANAERYRIFRNGVLHDSTTTRRYDLPSEKHLAEYQVQAVGTDELTSFLSEPVRVAPAQAVQVIDATALAPDSALATDAVGSTGDGSLLLSHSEHLTLTVAITVEDAGLYALDARYANGHGPVNTHNACAVRTLRLNGRLVGPLVLPQRGADAWTDWGYSNALPLPLDAGTHTLTIAFEPHDRNMNGDTNAAFLDHLRLTRLGAPGAASP